MYATYADAQTQSISFISPCNPTQDWSVFCSEFPTYTPTYTTDLTGLTAGNQVSASGESTTYSLLLTFYHLQPTSYHLLTTTYHLQPTKMFIL